MSNPVTQFQIISKHPQQTAAFYAELFGWRVTSDNALGYREIDTGSARGINGGIWPAPPQVGDFVQLFITVNDVRSAVERANGLGAKTVIAPTLLPAGEEMAVLQDPGGMSFGIWKAAAE